MSQYDFKINYEYDGVNYPLPHAFFDKELKFTWDVPYGITQKSYIFQMRTVDPVLYSDGETYMCAYYSSARVYSSNKFHTIDTINGASIDIDNWAGVCEIRLRVFDQYGLQYCTHDTIMDGSVYDFQRDHPQYRYWGSRNDGLYFCFDAIQDNELNLENVKFQFKQADDIDKSQQLQYTLQISDSPLFGLGLHSKSLIEKSNIQINTTYANISAIFQWQKDPEKWQQQSLYSLKPNTLYYCRVRAFDGYDYSNWSRVNAIKMIRNSIPSPKIHGVYYPIGSVKDGDTVYPELMPVNNIYDQTELQQNSRDNGQIIIELSVEDDDNDYVIGNLVFSMTTTDAQAEVLNVIPNYSNDKLDYNEDSDKLIRVRTQQVLLKIPTTKISNQHFFVTWYTLKEIRDKIKQPVYLYFHVYDGLQENVFVSNGLKINNKGIGLDGQSNIDVLRLRCHGKFFRNHAFPVLPDNMLKQVISSVNGKSENASSSETQGGSVGYVEGTQNAGSNWFDFWQKYENGEINIGNDKDDNNNKSPKLYGTERITQQNIIVNYYNKYQMFGVQDENYNISSSYPISSFASSSSIEIEGFIMFCLKCNELQIMQNKILLSNNKIYESLETAFPDNSFDGTPYKLIFVCPKCQSVMYMESKYQEDLAYGTNSMIQKDNYSYYHGYNSGVNYLDDTGLMMQLMATRQKQYDAFVKDWESKNSNQKCPYTFQLFSQWYEEGEGEEGVETEQNSNLMSNESFGFMPEKALLNLTKRPEFESIMHIHPPHILNYKYAPYVDGTRLNELIQSDYMYGYKPEEGGTSLEGDPIPPNPGDPDLMRLADQFPWNIRNRMNYEFVQGKKSIEYDEETSYGGAQGGEQGEDKNESGEQQEEKEDNEVEVYDIIHVRFDAENPCVSHRYDNERKITTVYNRAVLTLNISFPLLIQKNYNDKFKICINDKLIIQGSILSDNIEIQNCNFPYTNNNANSYLSNLFGKENGYLTKMLGEAFAVPSVNDNEFNKYNTNIANEFTQTMKFMIFGKMVKTIQKIELVKCDNSCYTLFGLEPSVIFQNSSDFPGTVNGSDQCEQPYIFMNETYSDKNVGDEKHRYYYTILQQNVHEYDWQENPVDNTIEDDFGVLSKFSNGQPLFTCYKDQVNKEGFHFKFTPEDFQKTGKIYVRKYHVEPCNSFAKPGFGVNGEPGFRDWIVMPIEGKPNRYYKKKVLNARGNPAYLKMIDVQTDQGLIKQWGYFESNLEDAKCVSHKEQQKDSSSIESMDEPPIYLREEKDDWKNKLYPKTCVVFDYVDITQAITKNIVDMQQNLNPFTHKAPINFNVGIFDEFLNRYGTYVMGGYDLTNQQKKLQNNGLSYEKTFSSSVMVLEGTSTVESWVEYTDVVPNNWRPLLINSIFDVDSREKQQYQVAVEKQKKLNANSSSDEDEFEIKTIDSYERYKKLWSNKVSINEDMKEMQMSQITIEQFNPGIKAKYGIYEKWGYQPQKRVNEYWKIDQDNLYGNNYIPLTSKIVHYTLDDPFADLRIKNTILTERKFISDKSFIKIDDNYDKLPYLDYRLVGSINGIACQYFSGYPRYQDEKAYQGRPQPVYPYDRQWRIGGLNKTYYATFDSHRYFKSEYENFKKPFQLGINDNRQTTEVGVQYPYGAYIDTLLSYDSHARFYYLQDEWNTYNRIHWASIQDKNQWAFLYAQEMSSVSQGSYPIGKRFSLQTVSSVWSDELYAWYIPYNEYMTDMIDSQKAGLIDGKYYRFEMTMINKNSFNVGATITSKIFKISNTALSPVNITNTEYDPWTKNLTIYFRFDDASGRKYDIVGFKYSIKDEVVNGVRYNDWQDAQVSILQGNIYDLSSNMYGDNVSSGNLIIIHKVIVNIDNFNMTSSDSLRVQLFSALSADRRGMTYPIFTLKLWANEFLKPVEERLRFLQGYKNRWVYEDTLEYNQETGESSINSQWKYVSEQEAVVVPGSIQVTQSKITDIEKEFSKNYYQIATFKYPDFDALEQWINYKGSWDAFYYITIFNKFMILNSDLKQKYDEFKEQNKIMREEIINKTFLINNSLLSDYTSYFNQNKYIFLQEFKNNNKDAFNEWYLKNKSPDYIRYRQAYIKKYEKEYKKFYGFNDKNSSSSSSTTLEISDDLIINFIISTNRSNDFIDFYTKSFMYTDTRFEERAWIMYKDFNVETQGLWWNASSSSSSEPLSIYQEWLLVNGSKYDNISDVYMSFLIEQNKNFVSNQGKNAYRANFLSSNAGSGQTYSQKYQALNRTLSQLYQELNQKKALKNKLEIDFRRNLIKQGYFCNGFELNKPYKEDGTVNTCFRWRVETRNYEGSIDSNTIYDEDGNSEYGYQPRFDMYIRFQMDFFNTFDSQNGVPLRDIIYIQNNKNEYERILASIKNSNGQIKTSPDSIPNAEKTVNIPQVNNISNNTYNYEYSAYDINALQFSSQINLSKNLLPGKMNGDILPSPYKDGWLNSLDSMYITEDDFKSIYYWRIAPYNVVERPVFESLLGGVKILNTSQNNRQIIFNNIYNHSDIKYSNYTIDMYTAYQKIETPWQHQDIENNNYTNYSLPVWKKSIESIVYEHGWKQVVPYNNDWINHDMIERGQVQFITDRPRYMYFEDIKQQMSSSSANGYVEYHAESYNVSINGEQPYIYQKLNDTYTIVNNELIPVYFRAYKSWNLYLFYALMNNKKSWFISRFLPGYQSLSPQVSNDGTITFNNSNFIIEGFRGNVNEITIYQGRQTNNDYWLFRSDLENIYASIASMGGWYSYGSYKPSEKVEIFVNSEQMSSSTVEPEYSEGYFKNINVNFIPDNLGNYDTIWYPYTPIRKKPFVLRLEKEYLMFTHKLKSTYYVDDKSFQQNVITISRGNTSNLFGEEGTCFPKYNYQSLSEIIPNAISFENPCVIDLQNGIYRMYFNVKFYDQQTKELYTEIYKADTVDFDIWCDYEKININKINCFEPFVSLKISEVSSSSSSSDNIINNEVKLMYKYELYVSSKDENEGFFTIKNYVSYDGINFNFIERIHNDTTDGWYNCCSPCVYEDEYEKKLYFTIVSSFSQSSTSSSEIVVSLDWIKETNNWRQYEINDTSRLMVEKGNESIVNKPFNGNFANSNFSNACVIYDYDYGHPVKRMYYNTYDTPYLWYEKNLTLATGLKEMTIHSEYLEEYLWRNENYLNIGGTIRIWAGKDENNLLPIKDDGSLSFDYYLPANQYIKYKWESRIDTMYGIKIRTMPLNTIVENLSQGAWIGYDNYMNTVASLLPEALDDYQYSLDKYQPSDFINKNGLEVEYNQWKSNNSSKNELQFLLDNKYYPQYLWWSRKGPGIYRYVGWDVMQYYNWEGDGSQKEQEENNGE